MKKIYLMLFLTAALTGNAVQSNAAVQQIMIANNAFMPTSFSINLGDTVLFIWGNGSHTTTSTNIPAGAMAWNEPMNSNAPVYMYVPTVSGVYTYVCAFHGSMVASFTVNGTVGIAAAPDQAPVSLTCNNPATSQLNIGYSLNTAGRVTLTLFDIIGNRIQTLVSAVLSAGVYTKDVNISGLPKGVYVLEMETPETRVSKKIVVQ